MKISLPISMKMPTVGISYLLVEKISCSAEHEKSFITSDHIERLPLTHITKTCLYNIDTLNPIYIEKLGFTGVYNIFLISAKR